MCLLNFVNFLNYVIFVNINYYTPKPANYAKINICQRNPTSTVWAD